MPHLYKRMSKITSCNICQAFVLCACMERRAQRNQAQAHKGVHAFEGIGVAFVPKGRMHYINLRVRRRRGAHSKALKLTGSSCLRAQRRRNASKPGRPQPEAPSLRRG